jgi:HEAT repeat protein
MQLKDGTQLASAAAVLMTAATTAAAADKPKVDPAALDKAFTALAKYDWGQERNVLDPINNAVVATADNAAARKDLEIRLAAVLKTGAPRDAKDYVCRVLRVIGTAQSVPTLAALLPDNDLSHMSRYALEDIPAAEAAQALRDALPKVDGALKVGVIGSLGARRDAASTDALVALLGDSDNAIACTAAQSLGAIGSPEAAKALGEFAKKAPEAVKLAAANGLLACAERLLAAGKKAEALAAYKSLLGGNQPKQVRLAATRGLLLVAGKKE